MYSVSGSWPWPMTSVAARLGRLEGHHVLAFTAHLHGGGGRGGCRFHHCLGGRVGLLLGGAAWATGDEPHGQQAQHQ